MDKQLDQMSFDEVKELFKRVGARLREFRPVRIRVKFKRCSRRGCVCMEGPADNSWGNLHGPYAMAQYQDERGNTRVKSLGRHVPIEDLRDQFSDLDYPKWPAYYTSTEEPDQDLSYYRDLSGAEFFERYGVSIAEDNFNRHTRFYATGEQFKGFQLDLGIYQQRVDALDHKYAIVYGVVSLSGQAKLDALLAEGYFLAE